MGIAFKIFLTISGLDSFQASNYQSIFSFWILTKILDVAVMFLLLLGCDMHCIYVFVEENLFISTSRGMYVFFFFFAPSFLHPQVKCCTVYNYFYHIFQPASSFDLFWSPEGEKLLYVSFLWATITIHINYIQSEYNNTTIDIHR
jgi:hypothetical protein